jgi:hypothetical protein
VQRFTVNHPSRSRLLDSLPDHLQKNLFIHFIGLSRNGWGLEGSGRAVEILPVPSPKGRSRHARPPARRVPPTPPGLANGVPGPRIGSAGQPLVRGT